MIINSNSYYKIIKWVSVLLTILAALTISLKLCEMVTSYILFLVGHTIMSLIMLKQKEWSLLTMNMVWVMIDLLGIIKWS